MFNALDSLAVDTISADNALDFRREANNVADYRIDLSTVDLRFAGQIATAVWLGKLTGTAACEALRSYAIACELSERSNVARLRGALLLEYQLCRERQDLVS